jgi:acyl-CoA synthetase (NDP forming)
MASCRNPVDMIASAGAAEYQQTIVTLLTSPDIDALLVIFTPVELGRTPEVLDAIRKGVVAARSMGATEKPVLACILADAGHAVPIEAGEERIPAFVFPENAARALGKIATYSDWRAQPPALFWGFDDVDVERARAICRDAVAARGDTWLADAEMRGVLAAFGMPLAAGAVARTADEAVAIATSIGFPVAAKLSSPLITHKTEIGGVKLSLADASAVRQAFLDITAVAGRAVANDAAAGVLIQPMIAGGVETMMGVAQDPLFGPLVAFGLGGVHVEILGDVGFRLAPLTDRDVDELLHGIKGYRLLQGYRGHPAADLDALRDLLLRLSRLADTVPDVAELDLNPIIALAPGLGCRIVDARIRVKPAATPRYVPPARC